MPDESSRAQDRPCFADRRDAGRRLAAALEHLRLAAPVILALPRGGVPIGAAVARALEAPLDVLLVRKIGAPGNPEFGIGAVVEGLEAAAVLDDDLVRLVAPPPGYLEAEITRQIGEIARRHALYAPARAPVPLAGRCVVLVDDGIATGSTARAALRALRRQAPARLVLAAPVASREAADALRAEADETVFLATPADFMAVGAFYDDFRQTEDDEAVRLLREAHQARTPGPGTA